MRITSIVRGLAAIAALAVFSIGPAAAQDQPPPPKQFGPRITAKPAAAPAVEVIATHGAWKIQCEVPQNNQTAEGQAEGRKQCGMVQVVRSEKNPKLGLTVSLVRDNKGETKKTIIRAIVPIGVFLGQGLPVDIDSAPVEGRLNFVRCLPQVCIAWAELKDETLERFKKGNSANFYLYQELGIGLPVLTVNLEGFSAGLGELDKL